MIMIALVFRWELVTFLWIYYVQGLIIGFFNIVRIHKLKEENLDYLGEMHELEQSYSNVSYRNVIRNAYTVGYVMISIAVLFILLDNATAGASIQNILIGASLFLISHTYSYIKDSGKEEERLGKSYVLQLMLSNALRVYPILLVLGTFKAEGMIILIVFLSIKTLIDQYVHIVIHSRRIYLPGHKKAVGTI